MIIEECLKRFLDCVKHKVSTSSFDEDELEESTIMELKTQLDDSGDYSKFSIIFDLIDESFLDDFKDKTVEEFIGDTKDAIIINFDNSLFKNRHRKFAILHERGGFVHNEYLRDKKLLEQFNEVEQSEIKRAIMELIIFLTDNNNLDNFINVIIEGNTKSGFLLMKQEISDSLALFIYLYFKYLFNGKSTPLESQLKYTYNKNLDVLPITDSIVIQEKYIQFFEVFDVINEYNYSSDILNRFLKMYQILEFLTFRCDLVKLQKKMKDKKTFIVQLQKISKDYIMSEKDTFKNNFKEIFLGDGDFFYNNFLPLIPTGSTLENEIKTYFDISFSDRNAFVGDRKPLLTKVATLTYCLRNSVVHNKDSELHLTLQNINDEHNIFIELIKGMLPLYEKIVFEKISTYHDKITYDENSIKLY